MPRGVRGPRRPAKRPSTLAAKGAAARSAIPTGSRPAWRATPGSNDRTTDAVMPTPTRETRSSSTLRRNVCAPGRAPAAPRMPTTNLKRVRLGLRGQLSGWAATEIALAVAPRLAPMRVGPPSSEEVRPGSILPRRPCSPDRSFVPIWSCVIRRIGRERARGRARGRGQNGRGRARAGQLAGQSGRGRARAARAGANPWGE